MRPRSAIVILVVALTGTVAARAYLKDYGPFPEGKEPRPFALWRCVDIEPPRGDQGGARPIHHTFGTGRANSDDPIVQLDWDELGWHLRVLDAKRRLIVGPQLVSREAALMWSRWADLNQDKIPDFMIRIWYSGCGLAGGNDDVVYVLSSGASYEITTVFCLFPGDEDYVDLCGDGRCFIVHTSFIEGEQGQDGKTHNYWVYNLLEIDGAELRLSKADKCFPKWVRYTYKPNHKATAQLTDEQKARLWRNQVGDLAETLRRSPKHTQPDNEP